MQPAGVQENERELLVDYYIQKVSGRLRQLKSPSENDQKRWIWELLQNAKDSIASSTRSSVDVEVEILSDRVIFRHNGEPFSGKALNSLIWQKSGDKRGVVGSSGRFGTGFLTTHTLSETVEVASNLLDTDDLTWAVNFTLHREGDSDFELQQGIEKTLASRKFSNTFVNQWTTFTYLLKTDVNYKCALAGIESVEANIFYNLSFTPEINSIKIIQYGISKLIQRGGVTKIGRKVYVQQFIVYINNEVKEKHAIACVMLDARSKMLSDKFGQDRRLKLSAAIEIDFETKAVKGIPSEVPSLFCMFPLIGSEKFNFPVVLNSIDFEPIAEREHLLLDGNEFTETGVVTNMGINKQLMKYGLKLYNVLLTHFSGDNWKDIHHLARGASVLPKQEKDFDKQWYKDNIQSVIRRCVLSVPIVETSEGLSLINDEKEGKKIYFPKADTLATQDYIWKKAFLLMGDSLPREELSRDWATLAWEEDCSFLTLEVLIEKISSYSNIENLPAAIDNKVEWLDSCIELVQNIAPELLVKYAIIPNAKGDFQTTTFTNFSINDGLPSQAVEILSLFNVDWNSILVKEGILKSPIALKQNEDSFIVTLNARIKAMVLEDSNNLRPSILNLVSYLPEYDSISDEETLIRRKDIYSSAKALFGAELPEKRTIKNPHKDIWEQADIWITKEFVKQIEQLNILVEELQDDAEYKSPCEKLRLLLAVNTNKEISEQGVLNWLNDFYVMMGKYGFAIGSTVPNQNGVFKSLDKLFEDLEIHEDLKRILFLLNPTSDFKVHLMHSGLDLKPPHTLETKNIAEEIESSVKSLVKETVSENSLEAIRLLVIEWFNNPRYPEHLYVEHRLQTGRDASKDQLSRKLFEYCFSHKETLEINLLWTVQERKDFQQLRKILPDDIRKKLLENPSLLESHQQLIQENEALNSQLEKAKIIFEKYPQLTIERIDQLLELEAIGQGWDTEVTYTPNEYQTRQNFENGWKGEAFAYKELLKNGLNVHWPNKTDIVNGNLIVDFYGEQHFINDKGDKYDLVVDLSEGMKAFVQVKTTVTNIDQADQIALPISSREWKFINETQSGEMYYLARVFNINENPELYLMKLNSIDEINLISS